MCVETNVIILAEGHDRMYRKRSLSAFETAQNFHWCEISFILFKFRDSCNCVDLQFDEKSHRIRLIYEKINLLKERERKTILL